MNVEPIRPQVEDGISDELTWAVKRHIAAAACLDELDAVPFERLGRRQDMRAIVARPDAERDDGGVLQQKELIGNPVGLAVFYQLLLKLERLAVLTMPRRRTSSTRSDTLSSLGEAFQPLLDEGQESSGLGAVDQPVIVSERQVAHRPNRDGVVDHDGSLLDGPDAENRHLRLVDQRQAIEGAEHARDW